ncbi:Ras subfamily protein [Acanthamoeba castellanii str. Neff]|uniref:Ras subfamily protein n=1 Tax=Acanthamoeba castellanii (strain ATCC 30010 / Neff) TaxID=1257118 RepID=L8GYD2_ACACF|nr:Ras subfamily protein [Acanthamoeba castellanii str. Neff]ELR17081.1 Ras subfamily protein [Acanthamoeba castellanii str. Neff]
MFASLDSSYKVEDRTRLAPIPHGECVLLRLPLEVLLYALGFLDPLDLCSVARTCTSLDQASGSDSLWRRFCDPEWFASGTKPCKAHYLAWIRPRMGDYARQRSELRGEGRDPTPAMYETLAPEPHNMKIVRQQQSQQDSQEHIMKVVVVGHAEFERTRLVRHWAGHGPGQTSRRATTIGVDFALNVLDVNGAVVRVQTWDIANQERFGNMVRVYLKEACGAVLVYDVTKRESFDRLPEWVAHVQKANIPSVIVEAWQVTSEEAASFAAQIGALGSITVSSRDDIRVNEAFMILVNNILEKGHHRSENMLYTTVFGPAHLRRCWVPAKAVLDGMPLTLRATAPAAASSSKCLVQ